MKMRSGPYEIFMRFSYYPFVYCSMLNTVGCGVCQCQALKAKATKSNMKQVGNKAVHVRHLRTQKGRPRVVGRMSTLTKVSNVAIKATR